jgi:hypothetical protein
MAGEEVYQQIGEKEMKKVIDWTKPLERSDTKMPARLLTELKSTDKRKFVVAFDYNGQEYAVHSDAFGNTPFTWELRNVEPAPPTSSDGVVDAVEGAKHAAVCAVLDLLASIIDENGRAEYRIVQKVKLLAEFDKAISRIKNY